MRNIFLALKRSVLLILLYCSFNANVGSPLLNNPRELETANITFENNIITSLTGKMERVWKWTGNGFQTISLKVQITGKEYAGINSTFSCDWNLPDAINDDRVAELIDVEITKNDDDGFVSKHLQLVSRC